MDVSVDTNYRGILHNRMIPVATVICPRDRSLFWLCFYAGVFPAPAPWEPILALFLRWRSPCAGVFPAPAPWEPILALFLRWRPPCAGVFPAPAPWEPILAPFLRWRSPWHSPCALASSLRCRHGSPFRPLVRRWSLHCADIMLLPSQRCCPHNVAALTMLLLSQCYCAYHSPRSLCTLGQKK